MKFFIINVVSTVVTSSLVGLAIHLVTCYDNPSVSYHDYNIWENKIEQNRINQFVLHPEDWGRTFLRNVDNDLLDYTASRSGDSNSTNST
jgi:hypothetical protein